ncbi:1,4-dihydroxy-6-naphthoate synthase [Deferrisoma palaeochoriense]
MTTIRLGYSPCPNDTFLFYALVYGKIDTGGLRFEPVLEDVETLNRWALEGRLPMTKVSYGVVGAVAPRYWCLRSGGALGWGCGPLVVAREARPLEELLDGPVAVPGLHTTAYRLLTLRAGRPFEAVPMVFHEVMPAVARGEVAAGLVIHEGRFTYRTHGLVAVEDLGAWWEERFGVPVPLGGILLRRDAGVEPERVQRLVRESVAYALAHPDEPMAYVRAHAQEMDEEVVRSHIGLYVNRFSLDLGDEGCRAVETLLHRGKVGETFPRWEGPLFPPEELPGA